MKYKVMLAALLCLFIVAGCGQPKTYTIKTEIIDQNLPLHKMESHKMGEGSFSGGFFLFAGVISGSQTEDIQVYFSFPIYKEYVIMKKPITFFRLVFDNTIETPTIRFRVDENYKYSDQTINYYHHDTRNFINNRALYAVITCKPEHWKPEVNLPLDHSRDRRQ